MNHSTLDLLVDTKSGELVGLVGHSDGVNGDLVAEGSEGAYGTGCAFAWRVAATGSSIANSAVIGVGPPARPGLGWRREPAAADTGAGVLWVADRDHPAGT
jgi:hypothetical protein